MGSTQQVRAGAAYVELTTKNTAFIKGLEAAKKRLMDFGSATRMIGMRLFGMGTAATAPLAASVAVFASFDDAMLTVKSVSQPGSIPGLATCGWASAHLSLISSDCQVRLLDPPLIWLSTQTGKATWSRAK